jgi:hypothetical protein
MRNVLVLLVILRLLVFMLVVWINKMRHDELELGRLAKVPDPAREEYQRMVTYEMLGFL